MTILQCGDKFLDLSKPAVMGVINLAPGSFSSTGRCDSLDKALSRAETLWREGADIIDIGAEPTNPGVHPVVSEQEELDRLIPIIEKLACEFPLPISVDTSKTQVMREAIAHGVGMINDVRALTAPGAIEVIASSKVAVCLMHMAYPQGKSANDPFFVSSDPMSDIINFLQNRIKICENKGIFFERIVVDPGIGGGNFGKNLIQNLKLLNQLDRLKCLNLPILIGVSRKTFIGELLNLPEEARLYGSLSAAVVGILRGAAIIRTHDVKATVEAVQVASAIIHA